VTPDRPPLTRSLQVEATPACLDRVHVLLAELLADRPDVLDADRIGFETALAEVVANIVEHTAAGRRVQLIVRLAAGPDRLDAELRDDGPPVEVDLAGASLPDASAEEGRGLALARAAVDDVAYDRDGAANRWRITRRRTG
jgi:serine/threonine-protein kinase RsbW